MEASVLPYFWLFKSVGSKSRWKRKHGRGFKYHRFYLLFDKHLLKIMFILFKIIFGDNELHYLDSQSDVCSPARNASTPGCLGQTIRDAETCRTRQKLSESSSDSSEGSSALWS